MSNALRAEIQVILSERSASVNGLSRDLGIDYDKVRHECDMLKNNQLIEIEWEKRVGGAVEIFYRATKRVCLDDMEWPSVPDALKEGLRGVPLDNITNDAINAIEAELYDSLEGVHMSRTPGFVDDEGWEELRAWLLHSLEGVIEIFDNNRQRLAAANAIGTAVSVRCSAIPQPLPAGQQARPRRTARVRDLAVQM